MDPIIIIGSSGHAKVVIDIIERESRYRIAGLLDRFRQVGEETLGYRVLGREEDLPELAAAHCLQGVVVAIGDNFVRGKVAADLLKFCPGLAPVSAVHPRASIGRDVTIGGGSVIMAGVSVSPSCSIGRFCILNTNSSLDHDSVMEEFASLGPRVATGGGCTIGQYAAVNLGSVLSHRVRVGEHTVIGAGSIVLRDVDPYCVAYGTPAVQVRGRRAGDPYLRDRGRGDS